MSVEVVENVVHGEYLLTELVMFWSTGNVTVCVLNLCKIELNSPQES